MEEWVSDQFRMEKYRVDFVLCTFPHKRKYNLSTHFSFCFQMIEECLMSKYIILKDQNEITAEWFHRWYYYQSSRHKQLIYFHSWMDLFRLLWKEKEKKTNKQTKTARCLFNLNSKADCLFLWLGFMWIMIFSSDGSLTLSIALSSSSSLSSIVWL